MTASIFISYCGKEGLEYGRKLKEILESRHSVFLQEPQKDYGLHGWTVIGDEIKKRDVMIVITTDCTTSSRKQNLEFNLAINKDAFIFAFVLDNATIPAILEGPNYKRTNGENFETSAEEISSTLDESLDKYNKMFAKASIPSTVMNAKFPTDRNKKYEGLKQDVVEKYRQVMIDNYLQAAIIREICAVSKFDEKNDDGRPFFQTGIWKRVPLEWFTEEGSSNADASLVFYRYGQAVAFGERDMFHDLLLEQTSVEGKVSRSEFNFEFVKSHVADMRAKGAEADVLLAPIDCYVQMANWINKDTNKSSIDWTQKPPQLTIDNEISLRLYWSNKYAPLKEVILMDSDAGIWYLKPDLETGMAITADIGRSELYPDEVRVECKTVAKYKLRTPEAVKILTLV